MSKKQRSQDPTIYTHIERDRRKLWHSVITIRERGAVMFQMTGLRGHLRPDRAAWEAVKEAKRIVGV